jgi:hypothetical protein
LLCLHQTPHQDLWTDDPAEPKPGGQRLREGPEVEGTLRDIGANGWQILALVPKLSIWIILDDRKIQFRGNLGQLFPTLLAKGRTTRIVEVREHVDESGWPSRIGYRLLIGVLYLIHNHAVVIQAHCVVTTLIRIPRLNGTQICGAASDHVVAGIEEDLANQIKGLLRPVGQKNVVPHSGDAVLMHRVGKILLKRRIALSRAVLQSLRAVLLNDVATGFFDLSKREEVRSRQPARKRDDVRLLGKLQKLPDGGATHSPGTLGQIRLPVQHGYLTIQVEIQVHCSPPLVCVVRASPDVLGNTVKMAPSNGLPRPIL